jgi:hypothetical protein
LIVAQSHNSPAVMGGGKIAWLYSKIEKRARCSVAQPVANWTALSARAMKYLLASIWFGLGVALITEDYRFLGTIFLIRSFFVCCRSL